MATVAESPAAQVSAGSDKLFAKVSVSASKLNLHDDTWTLASPPVAHSHPRRLVLQAKIVDWVFVNIAVEEPRDRRPSRLEAVLLSRCDIDKPGPDPSEFDDAVSTVLQFCREKYGRSVPPFAATLLVQSQSCSDGDLVVIEQIDQDLLDSLCCIDTLLGPLAGRASLIPRTSLVPVLSPGLFFLPNTRLVLYNGRKFVAKGPIYPSRARDDFLEAKNLLELPQGHPHIIPAPAAFITVSETDARICGFLTPFIEKGNLDVYAAKLRSRNALTCEKLTRWFCQLVDAVAFLCGQETWHGDLKPDNILVGGNDDLVLIDHTRKFTTFATASPEVRRHCARCVSVPLSKSRLSAGREDILTTLARVTQQASPPTGRLRPSRRRRCTRSAEPCI